MGKPELIRKFAKKLGISVSQAELSLSAYQEVIFEALGSYDEVKILEFAVLEKQNVGAREYVIPDSDEKVIKEPYTRVKIKMLPIYKKYEDIKEMLKNG